LTLASFALEILPHWEVSYAGIERSIIEISLIMGVPMNFHARALSRQSLEMALSLLN